jgi:GTP cyclohydrolase I
MKNKAAAKAQRGALSRAAIEESHSAVPKAGRSAPSGASSLEIISPQPDDSIAPLVKQILDRLGEDVRREGLVRTPERVERALQFLTSGYRMDVQKVVNGALFSVKYDEMVIMKDIEFFSMCEHHLLPFFGKVHVAYIPRDRVIGLSKLPRLVDVFARRLQIQERLTQQIAQTVQDLVHPLGVGVICEARHFCMMMRGVEKQHSGAVTSAMLGSFRDRKETRDEFLALVGPRNRA